MFLFAVSGGGGMGIHRRSNCNGIGVRSLGVGMGIRGSGIVTLGSGIVTLGSGAYKGGARRGRIEEKSSGKRVGRFGGRMDGKSSGTRVGARAVLTGCRVGAVYFGLSWLNMPASCTRAILVSVPNEAKGEAGAGF